MQELFSAGKWRTEKKLEKGLQLHWLTTDHLDDVIAGLSFLKKAA